MIETLEISRYMKDNNLMYPVQGMKMSDKSLIIKDNNGKVIRWQSIPEETPENREIYNAILEDLKQLEFKLMYGEDAKKLLP